MQAHLINRSGPGSHVIVARDTAFGNLGANFPFFLYLRLQFSQNPHSKTVFRHNNKLKSHHLVTFEKPGKISPAFRFHYADVRKRSMILVLVIFLYRIDGIIIVTANKNG